MNGAFQRLLARCQGGTRRYTVRSAQLQVPTSVSVLEYVWRGIEITAGGGTAIHCPQTGRKIGYEKLRTACGGFASWLTDNCSGSLAVLLPNSPEAVVSALGALEAGVPLTAFNPDSSIEELSRSLTLTRSPWIVTKSSLVHTALEAKRVVEEKTEEEYPLRIISIDDEIVFNDDRVLNFADLTRSRPSCSKTRTRSKTALLNHAWSHRNGLETILVSNDNLLASCLQGASPHLAPGERLASNLPIFTRYGLTQSVLSSLAAGAELVIIPPKGDMNSLLNQYQPSVACLVPSSLASLNSPPDSIRSMTVAGLLYGGSNKHLPSRLAGSIIQHYGPPEGPVVFSQAAQKDWTRLGQPVAGTEARVTVAGGEVGVMSEGEIWLRGPQFGNGDEWISSGDRGYYDPEGTFYLTKPAGMSVDGLAVWPAELEELLQSHEDVAVAAVFGAGSSLVAAVIPSDPYNAPSPKDLRLWLASKTAPHKKLAEVVITSSLPTLDSGEFDRILLATRFIHPKQYVAVTAV